MSDHPRFLIRAQRVSRHERGDELVEQGAEPLQRGDGSGPASPAIKCSATMTASDVRSPPSSAE